jgi:hypothetical protein
MTAKEELDNLLKDFPETKKELTELFKSRVEISLRWLTLPKPQLCGASPSSLLKNEEAKVIDLIYRIKTGDLS